MLNVSNFASDRRSQPIVLSAQSRANTPSIHLPLHLSHGNRARDRMDIAIATCVAECAFPRTVSIDSIQLKRHCASSGPLGMARVRNSYDGTPVDAVSTIATAEGGGSTNRGHVLTLVPTLRRNTFRNTEAHPPLQLSNMTTSAMGLGTIARTELLFRASERLRGTHHAALSPQSGSCITARCRSGREPLGERWIGLLHEYHQ